VWTAGTVPSPLILSLPCTKERGRIRVNHFLQVSDWPDVWAVGDCAFVPDIRKSWKISSANRATCHTRGPRCGTEYRGYAVGSSPKAIFVQNHWASGLNRSSDGCGAHFRFQFLGLLRMVAVADGLPQQVAWLGQKASR